ncbi:mas-related G-protein coupled receptor member H-like [Lacerta agilis]|uniref:mas-related G-protein coupled receptor member H-like n=1 Tax=Lacerta agilis TaxID=80427 RepID=UPI001419418D|nr:mas-related G-protein coupled receptor member H-like [Lacerta agilis]
MDCAEPGVVLDQALRISKPVDKFSPSQFPNLAGETAKEQPGALEQTPLCLSQRLIPPSPPPADISTQEEMQQQQLSTTASFSPMPLPPFNAEEDNATWFSNNRSYDYTESISGIDIEGDVLSILIVLICILGFIGNGIVIWLLSFCIKRNPFTIYILNLSVADLGVVTANFFIEVIFFATGRYDGPLYHFLEEVFQVMYSAGQYLLTAISIDRCVSVLFPIWHRCHRPTNLSTTLCSVIWVLSSLLCGINFTLHLTEKVANYTMKQYQLAVNGILCLPLMTISTLILCLKVSFKSQQRRRGKALIAIVLALLSFIIFSFPLNAHCIKGYVFDSVSTISTNYVFLPACLNSSVNPLIYFLVGRQKRGRPMKSMKAILQNVFKEEENSREKAETSVETKF